MLQQKKADDYVISSGITHNVKNFVNKVARYLKLTLLGKEMDYQKGQLIKKQQKLL